MSLKWKTESRSIGDLIPYKFNPRKITETQLGKLRSSIESSGYNALILVDIDNTIIAGHQRWHILKELGYQSVDVRVPERKLTDDEFQRINVQDNLPFGDWDMEALEEHFHIEDLLEWGFDEEIFAESYTKSESKEGLTDDDDTPETPSEPKTKLGDMYRLGNHRLLCGDSTDYADVQKLMNGEKADMLFTSPPYNGNTGVQPGFKKENTHKLYLDNSTDNKDSADYLKFLQSSLENAFNVTNGFIFWNISYNAKSRFEYIKSLINRLEHLQELFVWKKQLAMTNMVGITRICEFVFCFKSGDTDRKLGEKNKRDNNIWEINNINASIDGVHNACFPVALPEKGIELASEPGEKVLDLFGGTGTTMIAAEKTDRKCYMMELEPRYCDVIVNRWEQFTGKKAELFQKVV